MQQQVTNGAIQAQTLTEFERFMREAKADNLHTIGNAFQYCVNIDTIMKYDGQDLDFFEKDFTQSVLPRKMRNTTDDNKAAKLMFSYLEKCMSMANTYQNKMKVSQSCNVFFN